MFCAYFGLTRFGIAENDGYPFSCVDCPSSILKLYPPGYNRKIESLGNCDLLVIAIKVESIYDYDTKMTPRFDSY